MSAWQVLGLKRTADVTEIRRAYARKLKAIDVDAEPAAFIALRHALETALRDANTVAINSRDEFYKFFTPQNADKPETHGGFASSHWCGSRDCEEHIKSDLKVTIRCIPRGAAEESGACICCGNASKRRVLFAKSY